MRNLLLGLMAMAIAVSIFGCGNVGGSPEGASSDEMKATFEKLPIDERAKMLLEAPGPMTDEKKAHVKALYEKEGKTPSAEIEKMMGGSGTGR